jgi:hypothetical protein
MDLFARFILRLGTLFAPPVAPQLRPVPVSARRPDLRR